MAKILVADSLAERRNILCTFLRGDDHVLIPASQEDEALELVHEAQPDLIIIDSDFNAMKIFSEARKADSRVAVLLMLAAAPSVERMVELMKQGISDLLISPLNIDDVRGKVERALSSPAPGALQIRFRNLVGSSQKMQQVFQNAVKIAASDSPVVMIGERGTGKQVLAREIHGLSFRKERPFHVIRCAGLSAAELESELFGHAPGAFSWAVERRRGQFELSDGGSVYIDEIGEMATHLQMKLLSFFEEHFLQPLGEDKMLAADVRVLAGSVEPLGRKVQAGAFREDLFFRLCANIIELPPLRARVADIPELVNHFLAPFDVEIRGEAMEILMNYSWPGNIDELRAAIEQALTLCEENQIEIKSLPPQILRKVAMGERKHKFTPALNRPL